MEHWSIDDYKNFTNSKVRKTKYRANKTSIDGHTLMVFACNQLLC